ncbi:MAG: NAD(P)/FAD-dependent oxidoreductase [bacterium]
MKIAVVGSGISGIFASYLLDRRHSVTLYEKRDRLGGHSHTVDVSLEDSSHPVDTGFIVYNEKNYPIFEQFLKTLDVTTKPTSMGFSFRDQASEMEYGGGGLGDFFVQKSNLLSLSHWKILLDILRFYFLAPTKTAAEKSDMTLGEFLDRNNFSESFVSDHLIPMVSAIWSVPLETAREFPFGYVVDFFRNHGLLKLWNRPQWRTIEGGSREYIQAFEQEFDGVIKTNQPVEKITRKDDQVMIQAGYDWTQYDGVVLASHSDQSLSLLDEPTRREQTILGSIKYEQNDVLLHTDQSLLPRNKSIWTSWNYHRDETSTNQTTVTYNLSILQDLPFDQPVCVSLNAGDKVNSDRILNRFSYAHPVYNQSALEAQDRWEEISGQKNTYYAGAYWGDGFHEDGVESAVRTARQLGVEWTP